jgi:hypothetical protein
MPKINNLYRLWLKARHLPPGGANATIEKATVEELHPRPGQKETRIVLWFQGRNRQLILNNGNYNRLVDIAGTDRQKWPGAVVYLKPGKWGQKDTVILGPPATNGKGGAS